MACGSSNTFQKLLLTSRGASYFLGTHAVRVPHYICVKHSLCLCLVLSLVHSFFFSLSHSYFCSHSKSIHELSRLSPVTLPLPLPPGFMHLTLTVPFPSQLLTPCLSTCPENANFFSFYSDRAASLLLCGLAAT